MKFFIYSILTLILVLGKNNFSFGQMKSQELDSVIIDPNFKLHYAQSLNLVKRVYPIALEAKRIVDSLDAELELIEKNRKKKAYSRKMQSNLEDQFTYLIKDLYVSEGKMMMKLIHRETGMTVDEIIRKYRGNFRAGVAKSTLAVFGHDSAIEFDAKGKDWITDLVVHDIETGKVKIDLTLREMNKEQYKQGMKDYRSRVRDMSKKMRASKKAARKKAAHNKRNIDSES